MRRFTKDEKDLTTQAIQIQTTNYTHQLSRVARRKAFGLSKDRKVAELAKVAHAACHV